jgi:hypothetical protein
MKFIEKLDKLIGEGNDILKKEFQVTETGWNLDEPIVPDELFIVWKLKTITFLEKNIGSSNIYVKSFEEKIDSYSISMKTGIGFLNAIKDEIEDGSLIIKNNINSVKDSDNTYKTENAINFSDDIGLKIFISYSTKNKKYAKRIKDFFTDIEVDSFLAENDIEASEEWRKRIFEELISSNIFIFILSEEFKYSNWCGQEAGMAFLKKKLNKALIFPISIDDTKPYGFFDIFHAKPHNNDTLIRTLNIIDKEYSTNLSEKRNYCLGKIIDNQIEKLLKASSFTNASNMLYELTENLEFINIDQANKIFENSSLNNQIYKCVICKKHLKLILNKFKDDINSQYLKKLSII